MAVAGRVHGVGQPLGGRAEEDVDPPAVGLPARSALAAEHGPGPLDALLVFEPVLVALGLGVRVAPVPELLDEAVPVRVREIEKDLPLRAGDDVADLAQEIGVGRLKLLLQLIGLAGRGNGQAGEDQGPRTRAFIIARPFASRCVLDGELSRPLVPGGLGRGVVKDSNPHSLAAMFLKHAPQFRHFRQEPLL
jgi:hypothetical protein